MQGSTILEIKYINIHASLQKDLRTFGRILIISAKLVPLPSSLRSEDGIVQSRPSFFTLRIHINAFAT